MHTPMYNWQCFSCGSANEQGKRSCAVCGCSAYATVMEVERCRAAYESGGYELCPEATHLHEKPELGALEVLVLPLAAFLFGYIPQGFRRPAMAAKQIPHP